jgi:hypothetical protein
MPKMMWELDALKILARNETVPGIALRDAILEIERLERVIAQNEGRKNCKPADPSLEEDNTCPDCDGSGGERRMNMKGLK